LLENLVEVELVQNDRVDAMSLFAQIPEYENLGCEAYERASDVLLFALLLKVYFQDFKTPFSFAVRL
jgi:hypothetical protein